MATNINQIIFTRTQPQRKVEIINHLTEAELMAVSEATVAKIVKEVGQRRYKSRDKDLYTVTGHSDGSVYDKGADGKYHERYGNRTLEP